MAIMTTVVDELNDFAFTKYSGQIKTFNIEDLRFIATKASISANKRYQNGGLSFITLSSTSLLVLDDFYDINDKILSDYTISLATPPLVNFEFDLAFTAKANPSATSIKLSEVLQVVGYVGPRILDLEQLYMKKISMSGGALENAIAPLLELDIGTEFSWTANNETVIPYNTVITAAGPDDGISYSSPGLIKITKIGVYRICGQWAPRQDSNEGNAWYRTILQRNASPFRLVNHSAFGWSPEADGPAAANQFDFLLRVSIADLAATGYVSCQISMASTKDGALSTKYPRTHTLSIVKL